jgi:hypothetical protein
MSYLEQLKKQREQRVQDIHLDLPIPTWGRDLIGRFEVVERKIIEKIGAQRRSLEADLDFVIRATRELYMYDPDRQAPGQRMEENEDYVRVEGEDGLAVKWDTDLATLLGEPELKSARAVVMYCLKNNAVSVGGLAETLIVWMRNTDTEVAEALVGE